MTWNDIKTSLSETPQPERLARIRERITATIKPVRPLPSDGRMFAFGLLLFVAFSMLLAIPVGYVGFHRLNELQRVCYYLAILIAAALYCLATVNGMVPGSRQRVRPALLVVSCLVLLPLVTAALFWNFDLTHFVRRGIPCLGLGVICAVITGAIGYWFVRRGYASSPAKLGATLGGLAGLTGVGVLALACPIQSAAHIVVWHLGAILIACLAGAAVGAIARRRRLSTRGQYQ